MAEYRELGARFANWRAVIAVHLEQIPLKSDMVLSGVECERQASADAGAGELARYAA